MIQVNAIEAFDDNYIWSIGSTNRPEQLIVDPGDANPVIEFLQQQQYSAAAILITHHHHDHVGGITKLLQHFPGIPVYGPAKEKIPHITKPLREGDWLDFNDIGLRLQVLDTPGHTVGHICYLGEDMLFCGDTLFAGGCGRIFGGTAAQLYESLEKIRALPPTTKIYCAHEYTAANLTFAKVAEPDNAQLLQRITSVASTRQQNMATVPSLLNDEQQTNPFLRCHLPHMRSAAENFAGRLLPTPSDVFAVVRHWKDTID